MPITKHISNTAGVNGMVKQLLMSIISIKRIRKEVTAEGQQELKYKSFQLCNKIHREGREKDLIVCFRGIWFER